MLFSEDLWVVYFKYKSLKMALIQELWINVLLKIRSFPQIYNTTFGKYTPLWQCPIGKKNRIPPNGFQCEWRLCLQKKKEEVNTTCLHTACVLPSKCHRGPTVQMVSLTRSSEPKHSVIVAFQPAAVPASLWRVWRFRWQRAIIARAACIWLLAKKKKRK